MTKILFYKMTYDTGFAPNPFFGYLTLATCTPNHQRANLQKGDWIVGVEAKELAKKRRSKGWKKDVEQSLIYIAQVDEILDLDSYFRDSRFEEKKFQKDGSWRKKRGDNVYYLENGVWKWIRGHQHDYCEEKVPDEQAFFKTEDFEKIWKVKRDLPQKDIRGNRVFISKNFNYFGDKCVPIPQEFFAYVPNRGIKYYYEGEPGFRQIESLLHDLLEKEGKGQVGEPIHCRIKQDENYCKDDDKRQNNEKSCL